MFKLLKNKNKTKEEEKFTKYKILKPFFHNSKTQQTIIDKHQSKLSFIV